MKKSLDEHAERFSEHAADYDESQDSDAYRACVDFVVKHAAPAEDDVVLDVGTGTGAIAFALAPDAGEVIGRDISEGMLEQAREKAAERGVDNVSFAEGRFRDPNVDGPVDVVTSNFAMHHLGDDEKRDAIDALAALEPRRIVLGDVMLFGDDEADAPFYDPAVDDPATFGLLADAFTDAGYALTAVEMVTEQAGVLVAERSV
ncbi:class I SAM-dependent methyltransferase [Haloarcula salina]|uniref:class I SAM-dependent methyltransferase n=1 Tax=Haloarcula salina TaxID=1429914 RepID=UPI003C6FC6A0